MSETMMKFLVIGTLSLVIGGPVLINILIRIRRHRTVNAAVEGCLACGSPDVLATATQIRCSACGYTGHADRGGKMSFAEAGVSVGDVERKTIERFRDAC